VTESELDEILTLRWPSVVRRVMGDLKADAFTKGFVRTIARNGKRPGWLPSARQEWVMKLVLTEYSGVREPEFDLIEGDD
jgi:predicted metal-dependent peptidase